MVTIKDISRKCGVSAATVSKALNGYGDISSATAEQIRQVAREMHYLPNAAARQLKTNFSHNIGVLFVDRLRSGLTHEYFNQILNSLKIEAEMRGYDITFISQNIGGSRMSFLEHCRYRKCDGVVIACVDFNAEEVLELIHSEIPTVTIDHVYDNHSSILSDNVDGAYRLTKHLIEKGHRRIAFICGERTSVTEKRLIGFYKACQEMGIRVPDEYVVQGMYHDPEKSEEMTKVLMGYENPPTAIMYPDDYSYLGGRNQLEKMGLRIPEDISVVGYDGIGLSQAFRPRLTTYGQNTKVIGTEAARKLIEAIENGRACVPEQIMVAGDLLEGESVARPRRL